MTSRVYTIPASAPFLPTLIRALGEGRLVDGIVPGPLAFADTTIFLPTRRACRLAGDAFLHELGLDAAVLPRIVGRMRNMACVAATWSHALVTSGMQSSRWSRSM